LLEAILFIFEYNLNVFNAETFSQDSKEMICS